VVPPSDLLLRGVPQRGVLQRGGGNGAGLVARAVLNKDLRRLEQPFNVRNQPAIVVRHYCILLNFDPLRAVVLHDRMVVLLPEVHGSNQKSPKGASNRWDRRLEQVG
jgi:hypothetical protein